MAPVGYGVWGALSTMKAPTQAAASAETDGGTVRPEMECDGYEELVARVDQ